MKPANAIAKNFWLLLCLAALALVPLAANAAITYNFTNGLQGWTQIYPTNPPDSVWENNNSWEPGDNGHLGTGWENEGETRWGRSPAFYLDGSGDMTFQFWGGASPIPAPAAPSAIPATNVFQSGFMGVALRDVTANTYVLWKGQLTNEWGIWITRSFTQAELTPYANNGKQYTLDYLDYDWSLANDAVEFGWVWMSNVSIPGSPDPPSIGCDILTFGLPGNPAVIVETNIALNVPYGTDVANLAPTYTLSPGATCDKASGSTYNFTTPQTYTVVSGNQANTNVYTVTVTVLPDWPITINVNYYGGSKPGNADMDGIYSYDVAARGTASLPAPLGYVGNTWNDFDTPTASSSDLLNSTGAFTGVGLATSMIDGPWNDWTGLGTNRVLVSGVIAGYTSYTPIFTLTGLDPNHAYDLHIASLHNDNDNATDFRVGTVVQHVENNPAGSTDWAVGTNYAHFAALVSDTNGTIVVEGKTTGELAMNGFQLQDVGASMVPFVDITSVDGTTNVPFGTTALDIAGTNNDATVGDIRWNNSLNGSNGVVPADSVNGWTFTATLALGTNVITVSGTNVAGSVRSDSATVNVVPEPVAGLFVMGYWSFVVGRGRIRV